MSNPTLRQISMLELIPRAPRKTFAKKLKEELSERGYKVDERTIQRDLVSLERVLPLICDDRDKPYGWSWAAEGIGIQAPAMDPIEALTLSLAEQYLEPIMPKASFKRIGYFFKRANSVLKENSPKLISRWRDRVKVLPELLRFKKPELNKDVEEALYRATFEGNQVKAFYRKRGERKSSLRLIHPMGLVMKGSTNYLICMMDEDSTNPRYLPLQRFETVDVLEEKIREPKNFNLSDFIHKNNLGFAYSENLYTFEAIFDKTMAYHLMETPLNSTQKIKELKSNKLHIKARVPDTLQFEQWLMSFGADVEILKPKALRNKFILLTKKMSSIYK